MNFTLEEIFLLQRLEYLLQINHPNFRFYLNFEPINKPEIKAKIPPMLGEAAALKRLENDQKGIY